MECEEDLFCGVNYADKEPDEMDALEKKHTPVVEVEELDGNRYRVTVKVGEYKDHPNEHNHFIESIELYSGRTFLGRATFASARSNPEATFEVKLDHKHPFVAFARCNMHGTWRSRGKEI
ncbi:MAG: desulfoferrodoxin family protein [Candidatus Aenigmatarchaeota archaeon]